MLAVVDNTYQMDLKSKNIASLGSQISNIDREINLINENSNSMKKIVFYNGSGQKGEIIVWRSLDQPLKDFLLDFFEKQKQLVYEQISKELHSDKQPSHQYVDIKSVCDVCGSDDIIEAPHMGKNCNRCNPL